MDKKRLRAIAGRGLLMARNSIYKVEELPGKHYVNQLQLGTIINTDKYADRRASLTIESTSPGETGNVVRKVMKTPMACYGSTFPRVAACATSLRLSATTSPTI